MKLPKNFFSKDLSRTLDKPDWFGKDILYVGANGSEAQEYDSTTDKLHNISLSYGFKLLSIPEIVYGSIDPEQIAYLIPNSQMRLSEVDFSAANRSVWKSFFPRKALSYNGAFLHINNGEIVIGYSVPDNETLEDSLTAFCAYLTKPKRDYGDVQASRFGLIVEYPEDEIADRAFEVEVMKLSDEIKERIKKLRLYGVSEIAIKALFQKEQKLSRLVITDDYRIILPDYGNMEIRMEPLPKAVYFLYLRHPEGLMFKELPGYRDEFMEIYRRLTNRRDAVALRSAERVLDPTNNSINEKCSRIREAFISRFDDTLACKYYITHYHHYKKHIQLDRSLVDLGPTGRE